MATALRDFYDAKLVTLQQQVNLATTEPGRSTTELELARTHLTQLTTTIGETDSSIADQRGALASPLLTATDIEAGGADLRTTLIERRRLQAQLLTAQFNEHNAVQYRGLYQRTLDNLDKQLQNSVPLSVQTT